MKKIAFIVCAILLAAGVSSGCSQRDGASPVTEESRSEPSEQSQVGYVPLDGGGINLVQFQPVAPGDTIAVMDTSMGTIRIKLFPEHAPKTVENFVKLSQQGYYNGKTFHSVIEGYLIQGGALNSNGVGGSSIYTDASGNPIPFEDEFSADLWHFRGALAMANSGEPNTNMSQFRIVQNDWLDEAMLEQLRAAQFPGKVIEQYAQTGGAPNLDWKHTVFGQVIEGMEAVDAIASTPVLEIINQEGKKEKGDRPVEDVIIFSVTIGTA